MMNAGPIERGAWALLLWALACVGCERLTPDPPPPPSRHEIPAAPPAAMGAHAASNPGAAPVLEQPGATPPEPEVDGDSSEPAPEAGKDAGVVQPPAPEGVTL